MNRDYRFMKKAIIYGASGLVGSYILKLLLNDSNYEEVIIVVRKDLGIQHPKLKSLIGDFSTLDSLTKNLVADEVYIALGSTKKKTPDRADYYQIDHDYPVLAAELAKANGAKTVLLVSAVGANTRSNVFYTATKGKTEQDIIDWDFDHTYIFRPSMILGDRNEKRSLEKALQAIWKVINPLFIGAFKRYRGCEAENIARAMVNAANRLHDKVKVLHWGEMSALLMEKENNN